jgi:hypothetical protein
MVISDFCDAKFTSAHQFMQYSAMGILLMASLP